MGELSSGGPSNLLGPQRSAENEMVGIWARLFGRQQIGAHDNFLELGGHSLLALQLISRIREVFGVEVGLRTVFQTSNLSALVGQVRAAQLTGVEPLMPPLRPVPRDRELSLSFSQLRQWFLVLLDPQTSAYSQRSAFRLSGPLSLSALTQSFNEIVRRHESLRTTFTAIDGEPLQLISPALDLAVPVVDLRQLSPSRRQAEVRRCVREAGRCFDLSQGPLLRALLLRLAVDEHVLLLTAHNLICDDWSMEVLRWEIVTLYESFAVGRPSPLPALALHYADFAHWQRQWLRGGVLESHLDYWRAQLAGASRALQLPTDRPRPPLRTNRGAVRTMSLSAGLAEAARSCAVRQGVTLFMFFLATLKTLLYRYTAQDSISVGTFAANRRQQQIEPLIGLFVNTLVLHTRLAGLPRFRSPTFLELLARVRDTTLGAYEHQDLPFEKLLEVLGPKRDPSRTPLFQVMLLVPSFPVPTLEMRQVKVSPLNLAENTRAEFDLTLRVREVAGGELAADLQFNIDLFDPATAERLVSQFRLLLTAAAADPTARLSELPLLSAAERHQMLLEWNQTGSGYPYERWVHELVEAQAERAGEALAIVDGDRHWTYGELNARVNQLAHHLLRACGVGPETLVAICLDRSSEMVTAMLATLKAGGAYLPLEPGTPVRRLIGILDDSAASLLLVRERPRQQLSGPGRKLLCLDAANSLIALEDRRNPLRRPTANNAAYVIYTSGSTGTPKGVVVTHGSLVNLVATAARIYEVEPNDRVLQFTSCTFDPSAEEIFTCLTQGATLVLRDEAMLASPAAFLHQCQQWGISVLGLPTAYWHELADHLARRSSSPGGSLRLATIGGERALAERLREWREAAGDRLRLVNCYGPTEGTVFATTWEPPARFAGRVMPIGRPIPNVQTYLLDRELRPVPIGVPGQLCIAGAGLARGYLDRPKLTAAGFTPAPSARTPGARLYQTGDLARYLATGAIEFLGRIDHQVKIRGFRVELGEIAAVLRRLPGVKEAVVVAARPDSGRPWRRREASGTIQVVAYLHLEQRQTPTIPALRAALKQQLPDYMIPTVFVPLDALPLTSSGKVDRSALPAPGAIARELEDDFVAPATETEKLLAHLWSHLLGIEQVSASDSFFDLGGHSLLVPQLLARMRETFDLELPVRKVFETPTLTAMAAEIEGRTRYRAPQRSGLTGAADLDLHLAAEAALDPSLGPVGGHRVPTASLAAPATIFLTGATGFIGAFLLHELISRNAAAEVLCLVRATNVGEGWDRLRINLETYQLWDESSCSRIIPVIGDLSRPLLGLTAPEFHQLAERIDIIYHSGAQVSELQPYSTLRLPNVSGTHELLRLAFLSRAKAIHHISTLDVFNSRVYTRTGIIYESDPLAHWQGLERGYSQSKWVAEKMMMEARNRGLLTAIYRPGAVSGHSRTGASSLGDFTSLFFKGCIQLGLIPVSDSVVDLVPVDYLARAILHLSACSESPGEVFHLSNPQPLPLREAAEFVRSWGYRLEEVPHHEWLTSLHENVKREPLANALAPFLPLFGPGSGPFAQDDPTTVKVDQRNTKTGLAGSNIVCPPVDQELLHVYFSYFRHSGFLEDPPRYFR